MSRFNRIIDMTAALHRGRPVPPMLYAMLASLLVHAIAGVFVLSRLQKRPMTRSFPIEVEIKLVPPRASEIAPPPSATAARMPPRKGSEPNRNARAAPVAEPAARTPSTRDKTEAPLPPVTSLPAESSDSAPSSSRAVTEAKDANPAGSGPQGEAPTLARFDAAYLNNPPPPYPPSARRLGLEGTVIVRVLVTPAGAAEQVEVAQSSGVAMLDQAALNAVRHWLFVPARRGNRPTTALVDVPIRFRLN